LHSAFGDFDGNGEVDENDYLVWSTHLQSADEPRADANSDGIVDAADYVLWRKFSSAGGGSGFTVPEPHCASVWVVICGFAICRRWQRGARINGGN
jgi:hypothetical protein